MNNKIAPIPTLYHQHYFRSRLEARWAVFFDAIGVSWQYEPQGYKLPDGTCYLPDFFVPAFGAFVEVKPVGGAAFRVAREFAKHSRESVLLLDGAPACKPYTVLNTYECDDPNRDPELVEQELVFRQKFLVGDGRPFLDAPGNFSVSMSLSAAEVFGEDVLSAITIANSARFDGAGRDDHFKARVNAITFGFPKSPPYEDDGNALDLLSGGA